MTLKELKKRHESGEKQIKTVRSQIKAQVLRKCAQRGCNTSLAFMNGKRFLCDEHKGTALAQAPKTNSKKQLVVRKTKAEVRKANRLKKKRYYERHGIKFDKTIRNRNALASKFGVDYQGQTLLYEHYKEPLAPIDKGKGYGFYGTVAMTSDKTLVQCHICGNLFPSVGAHLRKHKITAEKYKQMFQLAATTALISEPVRENIQKRVVSTGVVQKNGELPVWLKEYNRKVQSGEIKHPGTKRRQGGLSLEKRNERGLCPDQVLEKIRVLAEKLGHTPSIDEFNEEYKGRFVGSIKFQHGSYLNAVKKLGMKSAKELKEHTREELLEKLVEFNEEHGRIPMTSDFSRGLLPSRGAYFRFFGTLNNARIEAGLNAVLPLGFGKMVEVTPEQYIEYKLNQTVKEPKKSKKQKLEFSYDV